MHEKRGLREWRSTKGNSPGNADATSQNVRGRRSLALEQRLVLSEEANAFNRLPNLVVYRAVTRGLRVRFQLKSHGRGERATSSTRKARALSAFFEPCVVVLDGFDRTAKKKQRQ
jgi:hypothetical protein